MKKTICFLMGIFVLSISPEGTAGMPEEIRTRSEIEMVLIPEGWFQMSAPGGKSVRVWVDSFYMAKYPVTQASFQRIMGINPSRWRDESNPVESITWAGAAKYCNRLSRQEGLQPVYNEETWEINYNAGGYRLPTEAEWEYAARAGTDTKYFWGDEPRNLRIFAWVDENSGGRTRPVGRKPPNPFGLHDIYGNVMEWCNDFYQQDYYPSENEENPRGPGEGELKVVRGGAWDASPDEANSVFRGSAKPGYVDICTAAYDIYGFRIVRGAK